MTWCDKIGTWVKSNSVTERMPQEWVKYHRHTSACEWIPKWVLPSHSLYTLTREHYPSTLSSPSLYIRTPTLYTLLSLSLPLLYTLLSLILHSPLPFTTSHRTPSFYTLLSLTLLPHMVGKQGGEAGEGWEWEEWSERVMWSEWSERGSLTWGEAREGWEEWVEWLDNRKHGSLLYC